MIKRLLNWINHRIDRFAIELLTEHGYVVATPDSPAGRLIEARKRMGTTGLNMIPMDAVNAENAELARLYEELRELTDRHVHLKNHYNLELTRLRDELFPEFQGPVTWSNIRRHLVWRLGGELPFKCIQQDCQNLSEVDSNYCEEHKP